MNLLWVLQIVLALFCISGGSFQIFKIEQLRATAASMRELPQSLWAVFGAFSCLAGVGLILPGLLHVLPIAVPISAVAVSAESALLTAIYLRYGDRAPLPYSGGMALLGAFIAYGRFALAPL